MTAPLRICHVVHGELREGVSDDSQTTRVGAAFVAPPLDLDELVLPRNVPGPAFDTPLDDVLDLLAETGRRCNLEDNPYLAEAAELMASVSPHSRRLVETSYGGLGAFFDRDMLAFQVEHELGRACIDGWHTVKRPGAADAQVRAFPPRLVHVMAGNGPPAAAMSIVRGALTKGVNLLKLPSNDLCTATAILRTMADIEPDHPTVRSFSAVYWRGGDTTVESKLFRPQYFDKLVAWGGEATIRHVVQYIGPGFELVQFDPKTSISLIGREAFDDDEVLAAVAVRGAIDATLMNQEGCVASRHQFVEGDPDDVDRYCALLADELAVDRESADAQIWRTPSEIRDTVEAIRDLPGYRVWGGFDGRGLVVRSDEPVEFHPIAKTVNVIPVKSLEGATRYANVATQTVGVYPPERKSDLRDALTCSGVQRVVTLGNAMGLATAGHGIPHDGSYPLQRLMRWVSDEDI